MLVQRLDQMPLSISAQQRRPFRRIFADLAE